MQLELRKYLAELFIPTVETHINYEKGKKLIFNYNEIEELIEIKKGQFLKIFFFNKENIHDILYSTEKNIDIDKYFHDKNISLNELFYLDLLIMDDTNIVNYEFSIQIIIKLCDKLLLLKKGLKKVILARIIIDLVESFKGFGTYNENINEKNLNKLISTCKHEILFQLNQNLSFWNDMKLDFIINSSIDELYSSIIVKLFESDLDSDEFVFNVIKELEIEEIEITQNIKNNLFKLLNFEKDHNNLKKKYFIINIKDIINKKKIHFYFILLKYILKDSFLIYHFSFLIDTRKLLIAFINNNLYELLVILSDLDDNTKENLEYIIKVLLDSDYYFNKYTRLKNCDKINKILNNKQLKYMFPLLSILLNLKLNNLILDNDEINSLLKKWNLFYGLMKEYKFKNIPKSREKELYKYLQDKNNEMILLKLFTEEQYDFFQKLNFDSTEEDIDELYFKHKTIIVNEEHLDEKSLVEYSEFQEKKAETTSMTIQSYTLQTEQELGNEANNIMLNENFIEYDIKIFQKSNKYKVIESVKTLVENEGLNDSYSHYTRNLSYGHFLIAGNSREIKIYNSYFEKKFEISLSSKLKNIYEISNKSCQRNEIQLMACCRNRVEFISIDTLNYSFHKYPLYQDIYDDIGYNSLYKIDNEYLICGETGGFILPEKLNNYGLFNSGNIVKKIFNNNYMNGININKNIFAFTSNSYLPEGDDILIIYDFAKNKICKKTTGYCFKISNNGISIMDISKLFSLNAQRQIMFCSCYDASKRNGILFFNINIEDNEFVESFYETGEFQPHCFCQLSIVENNNSIYGDINNEENINIKETEFFLIGGFDPIKRIGCIKLYKIKYNKDNNNIYISYIIDIINKDINKIDEFEMDVSCITQSRITGNLLITCLNGKTYLFKPPNLELFRKK